MAYTPEQVKSINLARESAVNLGQDPYSGAGSTPFSSSIPKTIPLNNLTQDISAFNLPSSSVPTTTASGISGSADNTISSTDTLNAQIEADRLKKEGNVTTAETNTRSLIEKILGVQSSRSQVEKDLGISEKAQTQNDTYNALQASKRAQTNELRALESSGLTDIQRASSANAINRKYAFEQADLSIVQDVANRNYTSALAQADRKIQLQLEPLQTQLSFQQQVLERNQGLFDKAETVKLQTMIDNNKTKLEEERLKAKTLEDINIKLLTSANEQKAPQAIKDAIARATTVEGKIQAAGQYGGDMLARQTKEQQFSNAKLEGQKLTAEIEANKPLTGEYASVVNGAAGLVANVKKAQVKANISSALANGNYSNAYAEIANAVSDGLTGTPKTKFDDARTDVGIMNGMRTAIQNYSDAGGDMNILKGTEEEIKRKLGVNSGKASALATQLWREFQTYRSNMTGAAFTPQESRDYASVNPTLGKSLDLNLNVIDGALSQLETRITSTVNARIPDAQKIYNLANNVTSSTNPDQELINAGYSPEQIQQIKAAK